MSQSNGRPLRTCCPGCGDQAVYEGHHWLSGDPTFFAKGWPDEDSGKDTVIDYCPFCGFEFFAWCAYCDSVVARMNKTGARACGHT